MNVSRFTGATACLALLFAAAIGGSMSAQNGTGARCGAVVELRQYTLTPQQRDALINLFDHHFVESQETSHPF
jgi:hypothetical protein